MLFRVIILCVCNVAQTFIGKSVRSEERTAAHAGVNIALKFFHYLFTDIIGHHSFCRALCGKLGKIIIRCVLGDIIILKNINKLWECRGNPNALFIFDTANSLRKSFLDNHCKVFFLLLVFSLVKIHKHCYKRSLTVCCKKCYNLILNSLNAA